MNKIEKAQNEHLKVLQSSIEMTKADIATLQSVLKNLQKLYDLYSAAYNKSVDSERIKKLNNYRKTLYQ